MALLKILEYPDPRLRNIGKPVDRITNDITTLIDNMLETMYDNEGVGLAAIQVNQPLRIFVMDLSPDHTEPMFFINPEITPLTETPSDIKEGCLSVPGFYDTLSRPERVLVKALDRKGKPFELECEGLMSVCVQHETDHLDGKLLVDYLSPLKRERIKTKLEKRHKNQ